MVAAQDGEGAAGLLWWDLESFEEAEAKEGDEIG